MACLLDWLPDNQTVRQSGSQTKTWLIGAAECNIHEAERMAKVPWETQRQWDRQTCTLIAVKREL